MRKSSPVNVPRGRRDSASVGISHFHKGIPVWIENCYEEQSSHYRSELLPVNHSTRPTWIPAIVQSVDTEKGEARVRTMYTPSMVVTRVASEMWPRNRTKSTLDDMVYFHHLHEPAIVNNIMLRYVELISLSLNLAALQGALLHANHLDLVCMESPC